MKAAVEARSYWARRRAGRLHLSADTARVGTVVSFVLALFMLLCAAAGLFETQRNDSRRLAEQHDALHTALGELRGVLGDTDLGDSNQFDAGQIALIERRSGLRDLRFTVSLPMSVAAKFSRCMTRKAASSVGLAGRRTGLLWWR